jgi:hypothetical protein
MKYYLGVEEDISNAEAAENNKECNIHGMLLS